MGFSLKRLAALLRFSTKDRDESVRSRNRAFEKRKKALNRRQRIAARFTAGELTPRQRESVLAMTGWPSSKVAAKLGLTHSIVADFLDGWRKQQQVASSAASS